VSSLVALSAHRRSGRAIAFQISSPASINFQHYSCPCHQQRYGMHAASDTRSRPELLRQPAIVRRRYVPSTTRATTTCRSNVNAIATTNRSASSALHSSLLSFQDTVTDWTPLYLSSIAGASTCIGAAIVFAFPVNPTTGLRDISPQMLCFALSLAGSVMITVSAFGIVPESLVSVGTTEELACRIGSFVVGGGLYYLISHYLLPEPEEVILDSIGNSRSTCNVEQGAEEGRQLDGGLLMAPATIGADSSLYMPDTRSDSKISTPQQQRAWRLAVLLFISLLFHNFPEGLAVSASAMENDRVGFLVAAGIAMHNIPEGICIAVPCLAARPDSPWLAFVMASVSGLAEPIAALVPLLLLSGEAGESLTGGMGNVLAFAAGIMVMVAVWELLPEARRQLSIGSTPSRSSTEHQTPKDGNSDKNMSVSKRGDGEAYYLGGILSGFVLMYGTETYLDGAL